MPTPRNVVFFAGAAELRAWFDSNHGTATELWLGYHSKRSGRQSITWQEVVDQELCFGWIDSVRYRYGEHVWAQRITPRRKGSIWSAVNTERFRKLEAMGLVHPSGRAAFERRDEARSRLYSYENRSRGFDKATEAEFRKQAQAWEFFQRQPPSYRRTAAFWVVSAKRDETRRRRLGKLIEHSRAGERLPALQPSPRSHARASRAAS
jgi:uncharacterized protein YdeI (YjbR/CyaY-like superfamily)